LCFGHESENYRLKRKIQSPAKRLMKARARDRQFLSFGKVGVREMNNFSLGCTLTLHEADLTSFGWYAARKTRVGYDFTDARG
jgi:hypothetical protein